MPGCRFATAFRAVVSQGRVAAGEWVAVHGCGGGGLSAVMIAVACGAQVVAIDVAPGALELARSCGATICLDGRALTGPGAVAAAVREATGGGAHLSLDALGSHATCTASIEGLRRRGRWAYRVRTSDLFGVKQDAAPTLTCRKGKPAGQGSVE
ncbi:zinc-binding dehydrogenase [Micromonospora sp. NPDC047548]|uniref:zinc-binding dehydrogenase n=1 Tax=Micromonospora sp. NPDC047548 TaxID=3155624 RepID=UPI0033C18B11